MHTTMRWRALPERSARICQLTVHMLQASFAQEWNTLLRSTTSPWTQIFVVAELAPLSHSSSFALTQTSLRRRSRGSAALESEGNNSHHAVWNKGEQLHTKEEGKKARPPQRRRGESRTTPSEEDKESSARQSKGRGW